MSTAGSASDLAPKIPTPFFTLARTAVRFVFTQLIYDNPFLWNQLKGKYNAQSDVEGPFYLLDPPSRNIAPGKGALAPAALLKKYVPFLLNVQVTSPDGDPIPNVVLDLWHADPDGNYYFLDYTLRGTVTTDSEGRAEIVSVLPGVYGALGNVRAGHFHVIARPPTKDGKGWQELTTQIYICEGNTPELIHKDFVNFWRAARTGNMAYSFSIPSATGGEPYMRFPELTTDDIETTKKIDEWNNRLSQIDQSLKIGAGANYQLKLTPQK